jgi:uncharacterized protein
VNTKQIGTVFAEVKTLDTKDPNGAFEAILSTGTVDRDGEIVDPGAFNPLPADLPIHVDHQFMDVTKIVGRGVPFYDGPVLKVRGMYASTPTAQAVRGLIDEGMIKTMSVGFHRPQMATKGGVKHVTKAELIEASFVSVPANAEALVTMAKAFDADTVAATLEALDQKLDRVLELLDGSRADDSDEESVDEPLAGKALLLRTFDQKAAEALALLS